MNHVQMIHLLTPPNVTTNVDLPVEDPALPPLLSDCNQNNSNSSSDPKQDTYRHLNPLLLNALCSNGQTTCSSKEMSRYTYGTQKDLD